MATIGQRLLQPESGWKRYDDTYPAISFIGTWATEVAEWNYNGSGRHSSAPNAKMVFRFSGTRLRIIGGCYSNRTKNAPVFIDGVLSGTIDESQPSGISQVLVFDASGLSNDIHLCEILVNGQFFLDAIDINSDGRLLHPLLEEKTTIEDMEIGDCIPCRYKATSGTAGIFSELGTCEANEIPKEGNVATPDGKFYFIKVDKGLLIADRVVQTGISWQTINNGGFVEGTTEPTGKIVGTDIDVLDLTFGSNVNCTFTKIKKNHLTIKSNSSEVGYHITYASTTSQAGYCIFKFTQLDLKHNDSDFGLWFFNPQKNGYSIQFKKNEILIIDGSGNTILSQFPSHQIVGKAIAVCFDVANKEISLKIGEDVLIFTNLPPLYASWAIPALRYHFDAYNMELHEIEFEYVYYASGSDLKIKNKIGHKIRSLSGGCVYADENGNPSFTDKLQGAFPTSNEYDTYIKTSTLDGKITAGDNNIWNYGKCFSLTKGAPVIGTWVNRGGVSLTTLNTGRMLRGNDNRTDGSTWMDVAQVVFDGLGTPIGFRPVLEFIEPDSLQENAYY